MIDDPSPTPIPPTREQKNWAMLAHLSGLVITIPFGNIVGPLLIWQTKKEELGDFVADSAREALNFQFTVVLMMCLCVTLYAIVPVVGALGLLLIPLCLLGDIYYCIAATIQCSRGHLFRYPLILRVF